MKVLVVLLVAGVAVSVVREHPWLLLVAAPLAIVLLVPRRRAGEVVAHVHGGRRALIARHEAGHVAAARAVGARVTSARVWQGGGAVSVTGFKRHEDRVAFLMAGRYAAGSGAGCGHDDAEMRAGLRDVPRADRARVLRDGKRIARRAVRGGSVGRYAAKLERDGHL